MYDSRSATSAALSRASAATSTRTSRSAHRVTSDCELAAIALIARSPRRAQSNRATDQLDLGRVDYGRLEQRVEVVELPLERRNGSHRSSPIGGGNACRPTPLRRAYAASLSN